jgi:hypothetical protein
MTVENKEKDEEGGLGENLGAVGQIIIGELETIGGILTADPITQAEGEYNLEAGTLHQESNRVLTAIEVDEEEGVERPENSDQSEDKQ